MMRIIAGSARGRRLRSLGDEARPTTETMRGALFSMLGELVREATLLDLFAGTGAMGLEALSRGASHCTFVDHSKKSGAVTTRNAEECSFTSEQFRIVNAKAIPALNRFVRTSTTFDLVFADPPYDAPEENHASELAENEALAEVLRPGGLLFLEADLAIEEASPLLRHLDTRRYGKSHLNIFERVESEDLDEPSPEA